jgi:hypothetical protein
MEYKRDLTTKKSKSGEDRYFATFHGYKYKWIRKNRDGTEYYYCEYVIDNEPVDQPVIHGLFLDDFIEYLTKNYINYDNKRFPISLWSCWDLKSKRTNNLEDEFRR